MPASASKAPSPHGVRYSSAKKNGCSLGSIFDSPAAFEDSLDRKKIDFCSRIDMLECQIRSMDTWVGESRTTFQKVAHYRDSDSTSDRAKAPRTRTRRSNSESSYNPSTTVIPSCRRRLELDVPVATVPLLDDCEIFSDNSSLVDDECMEMDFMGTGSTADCTRHTPSPSLRSLEDLDSSIGSVELEQESFSRGRSLRGTLRDGQYSVYPGWSRSYKSLSQENGRFRTSLHQHLVGQCRHRSTALGCGSARSLKFCLSTKALSSVEDVKAPLLKPQRTLTKHFLVKCIQKGIKCLACNGVLQIGIPRLHQMVLRKPRKLVFGRGNKSVSEVATVQSSQSNSCQETTTCLIGYLQGIVRHGVTSYSFWMDGLNEVFVAKFSREQQKTVSFYTCKGKERSTWRHRMKTRVVNLVGTMNFGCHVYSEVDSRGKVMHYMDSEFTLFDEKQEFPSTALSSGLNKYKPCRLIKALWRSPWEGNEREAGTKCKKELGAVVIRVPLEVKKAKNSNGVYNKKLLTKWDGVLGNSKGESVHVILPRGDHGHPICGLEGPRPLIERWRSGGLCDCGSWDLGCGMVTLSSSWRFKEQHLNLVLEGSNQKVVAMSLVPCNKEGLYRLSFQRPLVAIQAFATAVAILHTKLNTGEFSYSSHNDQTKLPVTLIKSSFTHPNPPLSPNDRL